MISSVRQDNRMHPTKPGSFTPSYSVPNVPIFLPRPVYLGLCFENGVQGTNITAIIPCAEAIAARFVLSHLFLFPFPFFFFFPFSYLFLFLFHISLSRARASGHAMEDPFSIFITGLWVTFFFFVPHFFPPKHTQPCLKKCPLSLQIQLDEVNYK